MKILPINHASTFNWSNKHFFRGPRCSLNRLLQKVCRVSASRELFSHLSSLSFLKLILFIYTLHVLNVLSLSERQWERERERERERLWWDGASGQRTKNQGDYRPGNYRSELVSRLAYLSVFFFSSSNRTKKKIAKTTAWQSGSLSSWLDSFWKTIWKKPTHCARDASHTIAPLSTAGRSGMFLEHFIAAVSLSKGFIVQQQTGTPNLFKRSKEKTFMLS